MNLTVYIILVFDLIFPIMTELKADLGLRLGLLQFFFKLHLDFNSQNIEFFYDLKVPTHFN